MRTMATLLHPWFIGQLNVDESHEVLPIMRQALAKLDSVLQVVNTPVKQKTEDEIFAKLICTILEDISESHEEANLKIQ